MSNHEDLLANFGEQTGAMLVAGREGFLPYRRFLKVLDVVEKHASAGGRRLMCVPAHDFTEDAERDDHINFMLGYACGTEASAGGEPGRATHAEITAALAAARALDDAFWSSVDAAANSDESDAPLADEPTVVRAVPYGPLAGVSIAFGVRQNAGMSVEEMEANDAGGGWEWNLATPPEGLKRVFGKDMDQRRHPDHVLGLDLGYNGDWGTVALDVADARHAERARKLAAAGLDGEAVYWILAVYD
ncbi:MAG: hypothetical protein QM820_53590 [Minicystis sp.]